MQMYNTRYDVRRGDGFQVFQAVVPQRRPEVTQVVGRHARSEKLSVQQLEQIFQQRNVRGSASRPCSSTVESKLMLRSLRASPPTASGRIG